LVALDDLQRQLQSRQA
jgi:hypothetical protein